MGLIILLGPAGRNYSMIPESPGTFAARCRVANPLVLLAFQSLAIDVVQVCDLHADGPPGIDDDIRLVTEGHIDQSPASRTERITRYSYRAALSRDIGRLDRPGV